MPFTEQQFLDVFGIYNIAIWPAQIIAYVMGSFAFILTFMQSGRYRRIISGILALIWLWNGVFYHIIHFSSINSAAVYFGILFIIQGLLFFLRGVIRGNLHFKAGYDGFSFIGILFVLYAMIGYPLLGKFVGHVYPRIPVFGVAPCPTTIFTFGILLTVIGPVPLYLIIIPFLWSLIGMSAAIQLHIYQDFGLVIAGIIGSGLLIVRNRGLRDMRESTGI